MTLQHKPAGLSAGEVAESRALHGMNILTPRPGVPLWRKFLSKFSDPLIIVLMVAGLLSLGISFYDCFSLGHGPSSFIEPAGIFIAIFLATGLSFYFENKAGKEFELLSQVDDSEPVRVMRDGAMTEVPRRDIVVGDIVALSTGDEIPADGILLEAVSLTVDESTLTGEPSCAKTTDPTHFDPDATFGSDRVMRGTRILEGHGLMEVTAVGDATENGKVFTAVRIDSSVRTPLDEQLEGLGRLISKISYILAVVIVVGRLIMYLTGGQPFGWLPFLSYMLQSLMIAVTLVVVSVPEGLPMAVTLSLAYSMRRMLRTNNLVRRMHACETMGATTVICTDKTGTLTENRMRVYKTDFFIPPSDERYVYQGIAVNSTAEIDRSDGGVRILGNPTEGALLLWLDSRGEDYRRLRDAVTVTEELPFTTERKYMATVVRTAAGERILYVKGAPEIVFGMCAVRPAGVTGESLGALLLGYQERAMRTLGFAYAVLGPDDRPVDGNRVDCPSLCFIGVAAISDPVRPSVPAAVREVLDAGIKVKIVTGDTPATAMEIGRRIGLWDDAADGEGAVITGEEFARIPDSDLPARVSGLKIIARARPMDKKRLVEALQAGGDVVAVTGDGTNDAPALKAAHVGLSMGDGTSVAKEASDITIVDNSFTSIGRAVMWGRSLYRNIQRFILFQMTVNVVACLIVLAGAFMGMQSPLTVTQMLWVNLIMDTFAAMALASLPPDESVMRERPRSRSAFIISRAMYADILSTGMLFFVLLLGFFYYLGHADITSLTQIGRVPFGDGTGLTGYELSLFFTTFVFLQFWNMFNARAFATGRSALRLRGCSGFGLTALIIVVGQIAIVTVGGEFFSVEPLKVSDWIIIIVSTSLVLWIGELIRFLRRLLRPRHIL